MVHSIQNITFLVLFFLFLNSCFVSKNEKSSGYIDNQELDSLLAIWNKDSLGCYCIRNIKLAEQLDKALPIKGEESKFIISTLGMYNELVVTNAKDTTLRYYFCHSCISEKEYYRDYCWMDLIVKEKKISGVAFFCI